MVIMCVNGLWLSSIDKYYEIGVYLGISVSNLNIVKYYNGYGG